MHLLDMTCSLHFLIRCSVHENMGTVWFINANQPSITALTENESLLSLCLSLSLFLPQASIQPILWGGVVHE